MFIDMFPLEYMYQNLYAISRKLWGYRAHKFEGDEVQEKRRDILF